MIKLDNVKFAYPGADEYAIKGMSLEIQEGSFVAIVGHNGCGKSTLSKLFNGLLLPTVGDVIVNGYNTKTKQNLYDVRKTVGLVFQNPDNQAVASIIEDDVAFGLENIGVPSKEIRQRVDEALTAVGMYEYRERTPYRLSGGQKQRVAIAGVVAMRPKVIVFDESTSMLDPKGRTEVLEVAQQLHKMGSTIIWVTHFMQEAAIADRVLVVSNGKIAMDGDKSILREVDQLRELSLESTLPYMLSDALQKSGLNIPTCDDIDNLVAEYKKVKLLNKESLETGVEQELINNKLQNDGGNSLQKSDAIQAIQQPDVTDKIIVNAQNVSYVYSPKAVFRQVAIVDASLQIQEGDFFGIIGHTGSGKSTFVSHLNGLTALQNGRLEVCGIDLGKKYNYKSLRSQVGLVFQYPEYQLFDETVYKDVAFGPKNMNLSTDDIDQRVKKAITQVGLDFDKIHKRSPFELSGGQKRRVALAGVLAMKPKVLILDEPTAGLDSKGKIEILELINSLRSEYKAIIMISHNMDEISRYCNKVSVWDNGNIILQGTVAQVFENVDILTNTGLDIPQIAKIVNNFVANGIDIKRDIFDFDLLVEQLVANVQLDK